MKTSRLSMVAISISMTLLFGPIVRAHPSSSEEDELAGLMELLEQETEIATKSRMNSDFVPGIVTVLRGDELTALGMTTVWEALTLVPGLQTALDALANPTLIVRGTDFPFNSGNVKIMVDGVSLSRETAGLNGAVLYMPIEQVDRIEFIRGPGSVIYGDFAFMGLVNIVTRKDESLVFLRADDESRVTGGMNFSHGGEGDATRFHLSLSGSTTNDAVVQVGRTGEADRAFGVASLVHREFSLTAQFVDSELTSCCRPAPPETPGPDVEVPPSIHQAWALEGHWKKTVALDVETDLWAMAFNNRISGGNESFEDHGQRFGLDVRWDRWSRQSWLGGVEYHSSTIDLASQVRPRQPGRPPPLPIIVEGVHREAQAFFVQNQIEVSPSVNVTAGLRYDDYDDVDQRTTPRLAVVWRASDSHIFKMQYAEGFRGPTFFELFTGGELNPNLLFEVNKTVELNYVYRRPGLVARATLFNAKLQDMIFIDSSVPQMPIFRNRAEGESKGFELEWEQQVSRRVKVVSGLAYVDAEDNRGATLDVHPTFPAAEWQGDLAIIARPTSDSSISLHWNWVGRRNEPPDAGSISLVDLTWVQKNLFDSGLGLRVGVDNLFDEDISYVQSTPSNILLVNYEYQSVWAELSYTW